MTTKIVLKKSNRQEKDYKIKIVAEECDCTAKQVRNILNGLSGNKRVTELVERVLISYRLLCEGENNALLKVRHLNKSLVKKAS